MKSRARCPPLLEDSCACPHRTGHAQVERVVLRTDGTRKNIFSAFQNSWVGYSQLLLVTVVRVMLIRSCIGETADRCVLWVELCVWTQTRTDNTSHSNNNNRRSGTQEFCLPCFFGETTADRTLAGGHVNG